MAKFITKAISTAKSRVSDGLSRYGTQRYEKQIQELQGELAGVYGEMKQQAVLDLTEFAGYEAEFNMTLLGKVVKTVVQLNKPSIEQVAAAALADPLDLRSARAAAHQHRRRARPVRHQEERRDHQRDSHGLGAG